jgi:hypothetical protein
MRPFILTLAALIVLNFVMPACTPAQSTAKKEFEEPVASAQRDAEAATKEAQKQAETAVRDAQNKAEEAQKEAETAQEEARESLILPGTGVSLSTLPSRATPTILVIPVDQIKPEDLAAITEDISVMCRVLDKKLKEEQGIAAPARLLIGLPFGGTTGTEGIYLEGYGALFLLKVDFPLTPPPEIKEEQPKKEGDSFWEETKRELHSAKEGEGFGGYGGAMSYAYGLDDRSGEKYDAEKVERLKTTLIKSLKHAANIRSLKPDDSIIISVRGYTPAVAVQETVVDETEGRNSGRTISPGAVSKLRRLQHQKVLSAKKDSVTSAVLTIRAKKSDVDTFAKGEIAFDQFRQKVRIHTY